MKLHWRAIVAAILFSGASGGVAYLVLDHASDSVHRSQQDHDVITYNDGFIDGENNIIDQCKKIAGATRVFYECPLPVVDR